MPASPVVHSSSCSLSRHVVSSWYGVSSEKCHVVCGDCR